MVLGLQRRDKNFGGSGVESQHQGKQKIPWIWAYNPKKQMYGVDSMPETAENVTVDFKIEREARDRMALNSQLRAVAAQ